MSNNNFHGQDRREPVHACKKCEECDRLCGDHSAILDFKTKTDKDITTVFDQLDKIIPELTRTSTYVKIGGTIACLLLVVLCVMTASSYMRLSEFIITHSQTTAEQMMARKVIKNDVVHLEETVKSLQDDVDLLEK